METVDYSIFLTTVRILSHRCFSCSVGTLSSSWCTTKM